MTASPANCAFIFIGGNYNTARERLMGRMAATENFLHGFLRHSGCKKFYALTLSNDDVKDFRERARKLGGDGAEAVCFSPLEIGKVAEVGTLYRPGPNIGHFSWLRRYANQAKQYSICGVTHTTAEHVVMDGIGESVIGPTQSWDALVCTSTQVKAMVDLQAARWNEYLAMRFGGKPRPALQTPMIPLGVHCDDFAATPERRGRGKALRRDLGIADNAIALLFVGRLTHYEKANPFPMYLALEAAAKRTTKKLHLIQAGWFANDDVEKLYKQSAATYAPSVTHHFVDARKPEYRYDIWHSGDIFTSLSDNIQETFGLTPIEAKAAGLPVVVSDWDGYRDTIRAGIDGLTVPTFMPPPGAGGDLGYRYASAVDSYYRYCMATAQSVAVDIDACTEAYLKLIEDKALRSKMGAAGARHAREVYDWKTIVGAYQRLWTELGERRQSGIESDGRQGGKPWHPLRDDPFVLFEGYPTHLIQGETRVALSPGMSSRERVATLRGLSLVAMMPHLLLGEDAIARILDALAKGPVAVKDILAVAGQGRRIVTIRTLGWMAKVGLIKLTNPPKAK